MMRSSAQQKLKSSGERTCKTVRVSIASLILSINLDELFTDAELVMSYESKTTILPRKYKPSVRILSVSSTTNLPASGLKPIT